MSRLARYKKPITAKLPPQNKGSSWKGCEEDSDDDFLQPFNSVSSAESQNKEKQSKQSKHQEICKPKPKSKISQLDREKSNSSTSEYFDKHSSCTDAKQEGAVTSRRSQDGCDCDRSSDCEHKSAIVIEKPKAKPKTCKVKLPKSLKIAKKPLTGALVLTPPSTPAPAPTQTETQSSDNDVEKNTACDKPQAVCPFCWKKLNDKLTGTVHVKSCAKNMPTNRIFDALQLQEKQIKEWEQLGIAYPGFQAPGPGQKGKQGGPRSGNSARAPRPRKKKEDPELALAIALSESLHEEVERRKVKENEFIVTNNLQHEIELRPVKTAEQLQKSSRIESTSTTIPSAQPLPKTGRRGKKQNVADFPLYKVSPESRKMEVEKRLNVILDESTAQRSSEDDGYFVREEFPTKSLGIPPRLSKYSNKSTPLWKQASGDCNTNTENFTIAAVNECKVTSELQRKDFLNVETIVHDTDSLDGSNNKTETESKVKASTRSANDEAKDGNAQNKRPVELTEISSTINAQLISDLLKMYIEKIDNDLIVFGREEKPIRCHKFIVKARSPLLFNEIVQERTTKGFRDVISLTCFSHSAVKAFVKFLYCGKRKHLSGQNNADLEELGEKYQVTLCERNLTSESPVASPSNDAISTVPITQTAEMNNDDVAHIISNSQDKLDHKSEDELGRGIDEIRDTETDDVFEDSVIFDNEVKNDTNKHKSNPEEDRFSNASRDMFEDYDEDIQPNDQGQELEEELLDISQCQVEARERRNSTGSHQSIDMEDELCTQQPSQWNRFYSPQPFGCSGKRPRSNSPIRPQNQTAFTATQIVDYLEMMKNDDTQKANKKHKYDHDHDDEFGDISSPITSDADFLIRKNKSLTTSRDLLNIDKSPVDCNNDMRHDKHSSTPLRSSNSVSCPSPTQFTPIPNSQTYQLEDPFDDGGDSCFLDLPSFANPTTTPDRVIPFPLTYRQPLSRIEEDVVEPESQSNENGVIKKTKGGKKQRRRALSQQPTPTRSTKPEGRGSGPGANGKILSGGKEMLDYSTIDTPILKKELKRFGLKPLPRSKAKVILRHIMKETNSSQT